MVGFLGILYEMVFVGEGNLWKLPAYLLDAEMRP